LLPEGVEAHLHEDFEDLNKVETLLHTIGRHNFPTSDWHDTIDRLLAARIILYLSWYEETNP
jgi:hypothetical protein